LTIEKVVWQLVPMFVRNQQSAIDNSSHPGPSDDRRRSSPHDKKMKTSASGERGTDDFQVYICELVRDPIGVLEFGPPVG